MHVSGMPPAFVLSQDQTLRLGGSGKPLPPCGLAPEGAGPALGAGGPKPPRLFSCRAGDPPSIRFRFQRTMGKTASPPPLQTSLLQFSPDSRLSSENRTNNHNIEFLLPSEFLSAFPQLSFFKRLRRWQIDYLPSRYIFTFFHRFLSGRTDFDCCRLSREDSNPFRFICR